MIYYVSGPVALLEPGLAVIDCAGVGYGCRITAYTASKLKLRENTRLYITESIREDSYDLYGFESREEQRCFELLTNVNGVGPKAALSILSDLEPTRFMLTVAAGDSKVLTKVKGIGAKTAQRIVLELKDKISKEPLPQPDGSNEPVSRTAQGSVAEALSALLVLGYTQGEVMPILAALDDQLPAAELIKQTLRTIGNRKK